MQAAKQTLTAIAAAVTALFLSLSCAFAEEETVVDINETKNKNSLLTTNNPNFQIQIDTEGNTVRAKGNVSLSPVAKMLIADDDVDYLLSEEVEITCDEAGSFSSEITFDPEENKYYKLCFYLENEDIMWYQMKYDNGWYIPDNGLAAANKEKLEHISEADLMASAYYVSDSADKEEISQTLEEIQRIADEVCKGETDDYRKAYLLYSWVGDNIYYDRTALHSSVTIETVAIHNALTTKKTTCAGFANTYCALLEAAGIRGVNLKGASPDNSRNNYFELTYRNQNHEFSAFWYEKENRWVFVDPCRNCKAMWDEGELPEVDHKTKNKFFDQTDDAFALEHRIDKVEERHYFKALDALEENTPGTAPEVLDPNNDERNNAEPNSSVNGENIAIGITIGLTALLIAAAVIILIKFNKKKDSSNQKNGKNAVNEAKSGESKNKNQKKKK